MKRYLVTVRNEHTVEVQTRNGWDDINVIDDVRAEIMTREQLSDLLVWNTYDGEEQDKLLKGLDTKNELDHSYNQHKDSTYYVTIVAKFFDEI